MKQKTIQFSQLRYENIPYRKGRVPRIWNQKRKSFIAVLLNDIWKLLKWFKGLYRKDLVVVTVLLLALLPEPHHVKALVIPTEPVYIHPVARLQPAVAISTPVPEELAPIPEPQPVAPPAAPTVSAPVSNDCVTGYSTGDYYLDKIISYESGGNSCATNPGGCFGLLQACAGEPLRAACGGNPTCQIAWFQANKTGGRSWAQVWQHELDFGWW